jgi:indolepyruvate ferredoxin oxidoreductase beta subunit
MSEESGGIEKDPLNLIITGVGGQGNILASQITATAAIREGFHVAIGETYGASQRGGSVMSHVRFSQEFQYGPLISAGEADLILGFEPLETLRVLVEYGHEETRVIFNPRPNYPIGVLTGMFSYPDLAGLMKNIRKLAKSARVVKATDLARELGAMVAQNVVMVGALAASHLIPVPEKNFEEIIAELFEDEEKRDFNLKAFRLGIKGYKEAEEL